MKVYVTGVCGQLGHDVMNELARRGHAGIGSDLASTYSGAQDGSAVCAMPYERLDITDAEAVRKSLLRAQPDAVIHCAAWTAVDAAEETENRDKVRAINAGGTRHIAQICRELGCKLMYISTDYVFDGQGEDPWQPDCKDFAPLNVYGQTKLEGELAVRELLEKYFIVRTAWAFGLSGDNFIKTILHLGQMHPMLRVVSDQIGTPTYAEDLAKAIVKIMANDDRVEHEGIYHYSNAGVCSWYDFAVEIVRLSGLNCRVNPVTTAEYPTKTHRPAYSVLDKTKIKHTFGVEVPEWQEALRRMMGEISGEQRKEKI